MLKESSIIEATELRDIIWIGHNTPRNTACFAFNDRGKGFVYQDGDRRISLEHPPGETRSSVLAVNSGSTELVGGGANRRVLVFNLPSGKRVQHLADNPTEAPGWITCIAVSCCLILSETWPHASSPRWERPTPTLSWPPGCLRTVLTPIVPLTNLEWWFG